MTDALHRLIDTIASNRFHSHRGQAHSTLLSEYILDDLSQRCKLFREDLASGAVRNYGLSKTPGARGRKADLLIAQPISEDKTKPDFRRLRLCVENKSVVTAHRNAPARYDDLTEVLRVLHGEQPEAMFVATVLVGVSPRYLNINDGVKKCCKIWGTKAFKSRILPRLSTGDQALWDEFPEHISRNKPEAARGSIEMFRKLPTRTKAQTHKVGYDFLLLVPVDIDNVNAPKLSPPGTLGIDAVSDYDSMIDQICETYRVRFH
jgi:hypothetical protein